MESLVGERGISYDARGLAEPNAEAPKISEISGTTAVFDAKELSTRKINLELRWLIYEQGIRDVTVKNPGSRHSLGVGILQRCKITFEGSPAIGESWLSRRTIDVDLRHYKRLVANGVLAMRFKGFKSWGRNPDLMYFGGNSEMRGYDYLQFLGQKAFFANVELRFPLIEAMLTPVGVLGGLRGVLFFNMGAGGFNGQPFTVATWETAPYQPLIGYQQDLLGNLIPVFGPPFQVSGFRLVDGRGSYGIGLQSSLLGFPMHFDWSWKTLFNRTWEDLLFLNEALLYDPSGFTTGSEVFRKVRFSFWIGYDF